MEYSEIVALTDYFSCICGESYYINIYNKIHICLDMMQKVLLTSTLAILFALTICSTVSGQQYPMDAAPTAPVNTQLLKTPAPELRPSVGATTVAVFGGSSVYNQGDSSSKENLNKYVPNAGDYQFHNTQSTIREVGGLRAGYTFDPSVFSLINDDPNGLLIIPRAELELMYAPYETSAALSGNSTLSNMNDKLQIDSIVASALGSVHFKVNDWFEPYVGMGVGGAWMRVESERLSFTNAGASDLLRGEATTYALTAQGFAGLEFKLPSGWAVFGEYKYLQYFDPTFHLDQHDLKLGNIGQHMIVGGLRYSF